MSTTNTANKKAIWVTETINKPLQKVNEAEGGTGVDRYTFTGPCADFTGEKNENERVYDKDDYGSHVEFLQEEIKDNSLLGELNHNEDYMVDMTKVSHMITGLVWGDAEKCYMITIKLLDTDNGKNAKAIVDGGAPLYISSRASGYIDDAGNVTLERIYTYDIVYRPGFKIAKLKRINESKTEKSTISIYERDSSAAINKTDLKPNNNMEDAPLKKSEFEAYTKNLGNHLTSLNEAINALKTQMISESKNPKLALKHGKNNFSRTINENENGAAAEEIKTFLASKGKEELTELYKKYVSVDVPAEADEKTLVNDMASAVLNDPEKTSQLMQEMKIIKEEEGAGKPFDSDEAKMADFKSMAKEDFLAKYTDVTDADYEATKAIVGDNEAMEKINSIQDSINELRNDLSSIMEYSEMMKDRVNGQSGFLQTLSEFSNRMADFNDLISKRVNDQGEYMNLIAARVNEVVDYSEKTAKHSNQTASYVEKVAENLNKVTESQNKTIKAVNEMKKTVNEGMNKRMLSYINKNKINENKDTKKLVGEKGALTKSVDLLLETVKKKGTDKNKIILEHEFPFVMHLTPETREIFESMNNVQRKQISEIVKKDKSITKDNIAEVVKRVNEDQDLMRLLSKMPKKFVNIWESASTKQKEQIIGLYRLKNCTSDLDLEMFWEGIDLRADAGMINENIDSPDKTPTLGDVSSLGYSIKDIDRDLGI